MNHPLFHLVVLANILVANLCNGHGYVFQPLSRNYYAYVNGLDWGTQDGVPSKEYCSHCLNTKQLNAVCGISESGGDFDAWLDSNGNPMPWNSNGNIYQQGQVITVKSVLTSHHTGHMLMKACPNGRASSQECFDQHPLEFVRDKAWGMPKDLQYPERGYYAGSCDANNREFEMEFRLPDDLVGEQVLLQWWYVTANSCTPPGYKEYYEEANGQVDQSSWNPGIAVCTPEQYTEIFQSGDWPERFVNCAEVTIVPSDGNNNEDNVFDNDTTPTLAPVASTQPPVPVAEFPTTGNVEDREDNTTNQEPKLMAYLGNWLACPSDDDVEHYTHIVIAFAVSYTWSPSKNQCNTQCTISTPPTCNNAYQPELISKWQSMGKKVILSFGGAGMGGSWAGDPNDCWDYCYGKEESVVQQLATIVSQQNLDGVDIDYEYFYEDGQNGSNFSKGAQAQKFLIDVTKGLRNALPAGKEIIHVPMEPDVVPGTAYYDNVLQNVADSLDYLMPQYYNGYVRPFADYQAAKSHYQDVLRLFDNDASKVVFGFCIKGCTSFNLDGNQASQVLSKLSQDFQCHGGAFFWMASDDDNGWSGLVSQQLASDAANGQCSSSSPSPPAPFPSPTPVPPAPVPSPTPLPPAPVPSPTRTPVANPTSEACTDNALPGNWGANGAFDCNYYDGHGGEAYCAHQDILENCCFCGGGRAVNPTPNDDIVWDGTDLTLTHYWDCSGQSCDATTLKPWNEDKYRSPPGYAPQDPNDFGGPSLYGEKLWVTAAIMNIDQGPSDECCGDTDSGGGGCGKCILISNPDSLHPDWSIMAMKKNTCGSCKSSPHADINVPGFDVLQFSLANTCGNPGTGLTKEESALLGQWYKDFPNVAEAGAVLCEQLPTEFQKGCQLFSEWGWTAGTTSQARYKVVECPERFKEHIGSLFDENGVVPSSNPIPAPTPPAPTPNTPTLPAPTPATPTLPAPTPNTPTERCRDSARNEFDLPKIGRVKERLNVHCRWFRNKYKNRRIKRKYCIRKVLITKGPKKGKRIKLNLICKRACMDINAGNQNLDCI